MHAKKIAGIYDKAMAKGIPVIGLIDCGGFRLQESVDALDAFGEILTRQVSAKYDMLQITAVLGNCAGGLSLVPALSDFAFMSSNARMFVNSPQAINDNPKLAREFTPSQYQAEQSGNAQVFETEDEVLEQIRRTVIMLADDDYGCCDQAELNRHIAVSSPLDTRALLAEIADNRDFIEYRPQYHPEMVTGVLRLNGLRVAAIANAPDQVNALTAGGCIKAADFVDFANRAGLPVLVVAAADGFAHTEETEMSMTAALARLIKAFSEIETSKINLIAGDIYGTAYSVMMSAPAEMASDITYAWDNVKVGMMEAEKAANIMFADDDTTQAAANYEKTQNSVYSAAARGSVDTIIAADETRKHLIMAFSIL